MQRSTITRRDKKNSFTDKELSFLLSLSTPEKIQNYLDSIPFNHEEQGETCMSPKRVLRAKKAHCLEGAMLSAYALSLHGHKPLILSLKVLTKDYDHALSLYKKDGYWGAISKTNHAVLGYRDPVYRTLRELVLSYFHEYFLTTTGEKTLRGYSSPINMFRFGTYWIDTDEELFSIAVTVYDLPHEPLLKESMIPLLRKANKWEKNTASISNDGK